MIEVSFYLNLVILVVSFILLLKSANYLIQSASILGDRAGISKFAIGISVIAIGTSLPELMTAVMGILSSDNGQAFVFGTVIGSNITNILLVFGALLFFAKKIVFKQRLFDSIFLLVSLVIFMLIMMLNLFSALIGVLFILAFIAYLYFGLTKENTEEIIEEVEETEKGFEMNLSSYMLVIIFIISVFILNLGAKGVIYSIENIGLFLKIPIYYLTLTTVAFATSLPELVVTYQAAKKHETELAIGNIFGSNISNILLIVGVSSFFSPFEYELEDYATSLLVLLFSTILFLSLQYIKKPEKKLSVIFFILYFSYIFLFFI